MKNRMLPIVALSLALALVIASSWQPSEAQGRSGAQQMARTRFVEDGVQSLGSGVQQVGEVNTLSAAVATTTLTEVVAAPASGSVYLRGIWVEKATASTGNVLVKNGTGTNCATGTATMLSIGAGSPAIGYYPVNALVPAANALCLETDAATTSARALTN